MNPFQPYCSILGIRTDDVPVVIDNLQYFEIIGSDFWLCMDVCSMKSCVSSSGETQVSPWYSTEGEAIVALKRAMETEADNVLAS